MTENDSDQGTSPLWTIVQRVGWVVLVIGALATVVLTYFEAKTETPAAAMHVVSTERLTPSLRASGLESRFLYQGEEVGDVWLMRTRLTNSGNVTLITEGPQANILGDGINFRFPSNVRLLEVVEDSSTVPLRTSVRDFRSLDVTFRQWRPGETAIYSFYLSADTTLSNLPLPAAPSRDVINGDVSVERVSLEPQAERQSAVDALPAPLPTAARIIAVLTGGLLFGMFFWQAVKTLSQHLQLRRWRRKYYQDLVRFITNLDEDRFTKLQGIMWDEKELVIQDPWKISDDLWAEFTGREIPEKPNTMPLSKALGAVTSALLVSAGIVVMLLDLNLF